MEECSSNFQDYESNDDSLEFEMYDENVNNSSIYDSVLDHASDTSDNSIIFPKKQKVVSYSKDSESDKEHSEQIEDLHESDGWENVTEKDDLPFSFAFPLKLFRELQNHIVSQDIKKPMDIFKLYFTDILMDKIIKDTNEYAKRKINEKQLSRKSICGIRG